MSNNPIIARGFQPAPAYVPAQQPGAQGAASWQQQQYGYGPGFGQNSPFGAPAPQPAIERRPGVMTLDDVLTKSGLTLGAMMLVACVAFVMLPMGTIAYGATAIAALTSVVVAWVVASRKVVTPLAAIGYAVVEGVFVGGLSKAFEYNYPGIIGQAVLGTFIAAGLTLASYKIFKIRVGEKFRRIVGVGTMALFVALLANFLLSFAGIHLGLVDPIGGVSLLGVLVTVIGTILAVLSLVTDFDDIQRGIEGGAAAHESWRAAFGLTVTMVWLYTNILRILSYLRD